jgi:DNA polymerase III epsilon subunit-like protein
MATNLPLPPVPAPATRPQRLCGNCKAPGHDRRNCPLLIRSRVTEVVEIPINNQNAVVASPFRTPAAHPTPPTPPLIIWEQCIYVLLDLETTGGSRSDDDIIELAAMLVGPDGVMLEDGTFQTFSKPNKAISTFITMLTSITNEMVASAPCFPTVATDFFDFIQANVEFFTTTTGKKISQVVFVAHNGNSFDFPFLLRALERNNLLNLWTDNNLLGYTLDTLHIARDVFSGAAAAKPTNNKLATLYQFFTGSQLEGNHRALEDVKALYTVLRKPILWNRRAFHVKFHKEHQRLPPLPTNDSDNDNESDSDSDLDAEPDNDVSDDSSDEDIAALGDYWRSGDFYPPRDPQELFAEYSTSSNRSAKLKTGLQVPSSYANSPIKAWRLIFTNTILEKLVKHTNAYGELNAGPDVWTPINKKDLTDFFAVLFIMGVQKRKDKPSHWFSNNPLLESRIAKRIISGRQFGLILRYLHCCDPTETGMNQNGEYDPSYKVGDLMKALEARWNTLFVPSQQLSLDETLLRAFGRMKFKVRIISKAARYGIKLYVVTDATTSYVLKVLVYTGKYTYQESTSESLKKTVQVVQQLVEPFRGSFRTVYVDRFYTSVDLVKELHEMKLFVTGTILSNRIPKNITIAKSSKEFRQMERGDAVKHIFNYKDKNGESQKAGLVAWKDRNIVYSLTNDTTTSTMDVCKRRGQGGLVEIRRPTVISKYNTYMGGVDVADMRRLHCSSTIMGQNRWWLKLFFYLLDVGTSNALVAFNEAMKGKQTPLNIVEFKTKLVESLVGQKLKDLAREQDEVVEHTMVKLTENIRQRCSYCALTGTQSRTRFMCAGCGVPYCSIGSGKTAKDCFALAHDNEQVREICVEKHAAQRKHTAKKRRAKKARVDD